MVSYVVLLFVCLFCRVVFVVMCFVVDGEEGKKKREEVEEVEKNKRREGGKREK